MNLRSVSHRAVTFTASLYFVVGALNPVDSGASATAEPTAAQPLSTHHSATSAGTVAASPEAYTVPSWQAWNGATMTTATVSTGFSAWAFTTLTAR